MGRTPINEVATGLEGVAGDMHLCFHRLRGLMIRHDRYRIRWKIVAFLINKTASVVRKVAEKEKYENV